MYISELTNTYNSLLRMLFLLQNISQDIACLCVTTLYQGSRAENSDDKRLTHAHTPKRDRAWTEAQQRR